MPKSLNVMNRLRIFLCLSLLLFPVFDFAQDDEVVDIDEYVEQLNDMCPISYTGGWGINSFTMVGDRYALVDLKLPANVSMFLSSLTSNTDNVKRLWIRQLKDYGEPWNRFVDLMVENNRRLVLNLRPEGSNKTALITLLPSDFNKE